MKNILFFTESLHFGGAEAVLTNLVQNLNREKFHVTVVSDTDGEHHTEEIRNACTHRSFIHRNLTGSVIKRLYNGAVMNLVQRLHPTLSNRLFIGSGQDIQVAACEGFSTKLVAGANGKKVKKVAWVHTDVLNYPWSESVYGSPEKEAQAYKKFDKIVCVSETIRASFAQKYGLEDKLTVLYNPIDFDAVVEKSREEATVEDGFNFVLAGSLKKIKGYDRLLDVCARLRQDGFDFRVRIMGGGDEQAFLENKIRELGLESCVIMTGYEPNPFKYIVRSDVYVCASYAEGYSTAVSEAIVLGVPVITTECSGMREIFGDRQCGIICDNSADGLYESMRRVLEQPELLKTFAAEERERAADFNMKKRVKKIEDFFLGL